MINKQISNLQIEHKNTKKFAFGGAAIILLICLFAYLLIICVFAYSEVRAQNAISLSVSPPLLELMIQPGKEVKHTYIVTNNGEDVILIPKIVYFMPLDESGNIELTEDIAPNWIKYATDPIQIKSGNRIEFNVIFSPPKNTQEVDHFLTLIFESKEPADLLSQNSVSLRSQIGTNILLTISKDGNIKKSAEIVKFTAPKVVDSLLGKISYLVILKNDANSYWKPIGKIITKKESIKLAPQNIISGSTRKIYCLSNENLIDCKLSNKFNFGKIVSRLEFFLDDDPTIYKKETITYAFPFSILFVISSFFAIVKLWRKRK